MLAKTKKCIDNSQHCHLPHTSDKLDIISSVDVFVNEMFDVCAYMTITVIYCTNLPVRNPEEAVIPQKQTEVSK